MSEAPPTGRRGSDKVRVRRPVDFIQLSKSRGGERPIREEPRALITVLLWELGRLCPGGSRRRAAGDRDGASEGKREPYLSIQDGKKGFGDFRIVFMGIQTVTGFFRGNDTEKAASFPYSCWNNVTGEMRVRAENRPVPAETFQRNCIASRIAEVLTRRYGSRITRTLAWRRTASH